MEQKEISFTDGKVDRRYTEQWLNQGIIRVEELPKLIESLIAQRREMVGYIESLHNKIDYVIEHNRCCDVSGCLTAGCTSSHK